MAGLFAARLAAAGHPITMLGTWQTGLQALRQHGVRLVEAGGQEHSYPVQVASTPQECGAARYALVLVKAWQTERAARQLAGCLAPDGIAISLQNGLGNREALAQALGAERVGSGISTSGATLSNRGARAGGSAFHPGRTSSPEQAGRLAANGRLPDRGQRGYRGAAVGQAGGQCGDQPADCPAGRAQRAVADPPFDTPPGSRHRSESAAVAGALGIQLPYSDSLAMVEGVAMRTAQNCSSMLQDIIRQAPTEIDAICGAIAQAGERAGVATPLNRALWEMVKQRAAGSFTLPAQARTLRQLLALLPNPPAQKRYCQASNRSAQTPAETDARNGIPGFPQTRWIWAKIYCQEKIRVSFIRQIQERILKPILIPRMGITRIRPGNNSWHSC
jgi:2-dehydropantoate 2-reductase